MVKAEHVVSELNFAENLSFQFSWFREHSFAVGHFCKETYLFSCLPQILSHQPFPSINAPVLKKEASTEGWVNLFPCLTLTTERPCRFPHAPESLLSQGGWSHPQWSYLSYPLWKATVRSMSRRKEKLSSRYKTSQLPQLIFALFDFHSLKRQIVNRIYILHVLSNLWISHLLMPPFEDSADPCFFYNWCLICIKLVSFLKFIAFSVQYSLKYFFNESNIPVHLKTFQQNKIFH